MGNGGGPGKTGTVLLSSNLDFQQFFTKRHKGTMEKEKRERIRPTTDWITKSKAEIENGEEILACRKIILLIVRYMKENGVNQKELAEKLSVSPQYINRLLHGQDIDL